MFDIIMGSLILLFILFCLWGLIDYLYRRFYRHPVYCEDCKFFDNGLCKNPRAEIIEDIEEEYITRPTNSLKYNPRYVSARSMRAYLCGKYGVLFKKKKL